MQQTILAIGALLIIMTTAMLYQRSNMLTQELAYVRQIEIAAEDAARMRLEGLSTLAFDESTVGTTSPPPDFSLLASPANFGLDLGDAGIPDDIDDFHGTQDSVWHAVSTDSFRFVIEYSVGYVTNTGDTTSIPTGLKEMQVAVRALAVIGNRQVNGVFTKTAEINDNLMAP